jgi:hypothetical protein
MPTRFAGYMFKPEVGSALQGAGDDNTRAAWEMARNTVGNMGMTDIARMRGKMDFKGRSSGGGNSGSGFNWGGAAQGLVGGLGSLLGGRGGGSVNQGFEMKGSLYDYNPSGIDFSSGWS